MYLKSLPRPCEKETPLAWYRAVIELPDPWQFVDYRVHIPCSCLRVPTLLHALAEHGQDDSVLVDLVALQVELHRGSQVSSHQNNHRSAKVRTAAARITQTAAAGRLGMAERFREGLLFTRNLTLETCIFLPTSNIHDKAFVHSYYPRQALKQRSAWGLCSREECLDAIWKSHGEQPKLYHRGGTVPEPLWSWLHPITLQLLPGTDLPLWGMAPDTIISNSTPAASA